MATRRFAKSTDKVESNPITPASMVEESLPISTEIREATYALYRFMRIYGYRDAIDFDTDFMSTMRHWQICSESCGWMKFLKYKFAAYFSHHMGLEIPPKPFEVDDHTGVIASGRPGRFLTARIKGSDRIGILTGILYLKKGMPRASKDDLQAAAIATLNELSSVKAVPVSKCVKNDGWSDVPITLEVMLDQIRRTVYEIFGGHKFYEADFEKPFAPSLRANYTSSRSAFGTFGTLFDDGLLREDASQWIEPMFLSEVKLYDVNFGSHVEDVRSFKINPVYIHRFNQVYTSVLYEALDKAGDEDFDCELVPLAESLKIRVISKGPPYSYFCLHPLQKFMHNIMRKLPTFDLIGQTVSADMLTQFYSRFTKRSNYTFLSLDYKAATDLINPDCSKAAVEAIAQVTEMPEFIKGMFVKSLIGHNIHVKVRDSKGKVIGRISKPQRWGQLMGSITSFPILCIINAAVTRYAYELSEDRPDAIPLEDVPLKVNGDDGLLYCNERCTAMWADLAALCGLQPSIGKVYTSPTYANINSTSFTVSGTEFTYIPYVNMGLVMGYQRSGVATSTAKSAPVFFSEDTNDLTLGAKHHELLRLCPTRLMEACHREFLDCNKKVLERAAAIPWYVPAEYGGLGLCPLVRESGDIDQPMTYSYGPSEIDRVAVRLYAGKFDAHTPHFHRLKADTASAREIWWREKGIQVESREFVGRLPSQVESLADSNDDVFAELDVMSFYLYPTQLRDAIHTISMDCEKMNRVSERKTAFRRNRAVWDRLYRRAKCFIGKGLKGFSQILTSRRVVCGSFS
jgi:hypothetical protein